MLMRQQRSVAVLFLGTPLIILLTIGVIILQNIPHPADGVVRLGGYIHAPISPFHSWLLAAGVSALLFAGNWLIVQRLDSSQVRVNLIAVAAAISVLLTGAWFAYAHILRTVPLLGESAMRTLAVAVLVISLITAGAVHTFLTRT